MRLGVALGAVVTRHLLALDDTRRIGAGADGAGTTVLGIAVGVRTAAESIALDDALESAALGSARDLHLLAGSEDLDSHLVAKVVGRDVLLVLRKLRVIETEAAEDFRRDGEAGLCRVSDDRLVGATAARSALALLGFAGVTLLAEAKLDRIEPNVVLLQNLDHRVGSGLHYGARDLLSLFIEYLGHAQFPADY